MHVLFYLRVMKIKEAHEYSIVNKLNGTFLLIFMSKICVLCITMLKKIIAERNKKYVNMILKIMHLESFLFKLWNKNKKCSHMRNLKYNNIDLRNMALC